MASGSKAQLAPTSVFAAKNFVIRKSAKKIGTPEVAFRLIPL
jgi:hypothetical protein